KEHYECAVLEGRVGWEIGLGRRANSAAEVILIGGSRCRRILAIGFINDWAGGRVIHPTAPIVIRIDIQVMPWAGEANRDHYSQPRPRSNAPFTTVDCCGSMQGSPASWQRRPNDFPLFSLRNLEVFLVHIVVEETRGIRLVPKVRAANEANGPAVEADLVQGYPQVCGAAAPKECIEISAVLVPTDSRLSIGCWVLLCRE